MTESPTMSDAEVLLLKQRALQLQRKKLEIVKGNGLAFYRPHAKQDAFHRAGEFKRRMVRAGNRFGKSQCGCAEDCAWILGERTWYPEDDPARRAGIPQRPVKGLVITTDWDKVDEIWTSEAGDKPGKVWQLLPRGSVKSKHRNHSGAIDTVVLNRGSILKFDTVKSFMANPLGSESSEWDFIHVDEPCPEAMWKASSRGLMDNDGSAWFTLTPLSEAWITDMFFPKDNKGKETELESVVNGRKVRWAITGSIYDNPTITKEAIDEYVATLTEDEKQCRLNGIPMHLAGLIYKEFDYARHVLSNVPHGWQDYATPPRDYTLYIAIDPHPQTPHAVLFCWISPQGYKFFCSEIFKHCSVKELSQNILAIADRYTIGWIKCDPLAFIVDPVLEDMGTMAEEFAKNGVIVEKATKALAHGILNAQAELKRPNNIFISPHLTRFLWEIQRYSWDKENRPKDVDDHLMENFYRLLLDDMRYLAKEATPDSVDEMDMPSADLGSEDEEVTSEMLANIGEEA